jgi:hypothetical protein
VCSGLKKKRREWQPEARDHLIYRWVKFDGMKQAHTAADFGISQATVSRIIDRYERWQAHADPREGGRLDPAERLRAQRWLTYERNELIVASALRIADRMEGVTELSKSVRTRPLSQWHQKGTEIRSEEQSVDRHGVAVRFLRLAFRVNMEQLKLVEHDAPPQPEPLTAEEIAAEERRDAAVAEEFAAAERRSEERAAEWGRQAEAAQTAPLAGTEPGPAESEVAGELAVPREQVCSRLEEAKATEPDSMHNVHKLHNGGAANSCASDGAAGRCADNSPAEKNRRDACIRDDSQTNRARERVRSEPTGLPEPALPTAGA